MNSSSMYMIRWDSGKVSFLFEGSSTFIGSSLNLRLLEFGIIIWELLSMSFCCWGFPELPICIWNVSIGTGAGNPTIPADIVVRWIGLPRYGRRFFQAFFECKVGYIPLTLYYSLIIIMCCVALKEKKS